MILKLVLTPVLIAAASLVGRRWGPDVSGWLVGLPFTSGPVAFFLALSHGAAFGATVAVGILAGTASQAVFCLAYAWSGLRQRWPVALGFGCVAYGLATLALRPLSLPAVAMFLLVVAVLCVALLLMPREHATWDLSATVLPRWDLPARMGVAMGFVLLLTGIAPSLGPYLSGLLAPFPLYATVLTVFAHQQHGPVPAVRVLRGLLVGLFAFASFFLVLALTLAKLGIAVAFALALVTVLALQGISLQAMRMRGTPPREVIP